MSPHSYPPQFHLDTPLAMEARPSRFHQFCRRSPLWWTGLVLPGTCLLSLFPLSLHGNCLLGRFPLGLVF
jgi:hypothetical protein